MVEIVCPPVDPETMYWIKNPSHLTVEYVPMSEIVRFLTLGIDNFWMMPGDQSTTWKKPAHFGFKIVKTLRGRKAKSGSAGNTDTLLLHIKPEIKSLLMLTSTQTNRSMSDIIREGIAMVLQKLNPDLGEHDGIGEHLERTRGENENIPSLL